MYITELIKKLEAIKKEHGDILVRIDSMERSWVPTPEVCERPAGKVLILNR